MHNTMGNLVFNLQKKCITLNFYIKINHINLKANCLFIQKKKLIYRNTNLNILPKYSKRSLNLLSNRLFI